MRIGKKALKSLRKMPADTAQRFINGFQAIDKGKTEGLDIKELSGRENYSRLRIGSYRAIYTLDMEVIVIRVGPRGDIYK
jgi:mRNA interferase RelE/StbE